ncbi:OmpH family outer membrane protein [Stigmatella erecta]|uniref:Periplasmic chaperone for outer membrane proteins Skp n=1 Tax=Stigmatella erecta TaxID=83460 RepID=A0A1I0J7K3_9BACT|nr:OmpH family outer membrane protein [Stigmatella erecta]SEU05621.1 periplasmic chaperone for outer membrane proteins Skp [Stigmatella erecta]
MSLRSTLAATAAALSLALPLAASAQNLKMGYVDYQRVLLEVQDGKDAKNRLQKTLDDRQKEIDQEQEKLRKAKDLLDKQASAMSEETRVQQATDLQKRILELAQKWDRYRAEAANEERQLMAPIIDRIDGVIAKIAERDSLSFVFERRDSGLVYAQTQYDLSNEVIRSYNALPKLAAPKPAAPKAPAAPVAKDAPKK